MNTKLAPVNSFQDFMNFPVLSSLEDFFKEKSIWPAVRGFADPKIKLDVAESEKLFTVKAELPGVEKKDIKVSVNGNQVSISCEVNQNKEEKQGETVIRSERYSGKLYRSFTLGAALDEKAATAKYENGVLSLVLPKKGQPDSLKEISIE